MPDRAKASRWFYRFPGEFYANGPTSNWYKNDREVRKALKRSYGILRLPRGFEVWRAK